MLPHSKSSSVGYELEYSDQLEPKSIASTLAANVSLFAIERFVDEFIHQIPDGTIRDSVKRLR